MFGRGKGDQADNGTFEIKTGTLNTFFIDKISEKRKKTNKISREDHTAAILSDASETEFRRILDEYLAEGGDLDKFQFYVITKGYYCIDLKRTPLVPYQEW
ncbi:MAG: hypothetical protein HVN35_02620 [Methanobacteriaceae archaeon]|nr:hypothetical protein [Methanobacteriaceae archaeon]